MPRSSNHLLQKCSADDFALLEPHLKSVELSHRLALEEIDQDIDWIYFPSSGIVSTVAVSREGERVEVGIFGCEGVSGSTVINGATRSPLQTFVQVPGVGQRLRRRDFEAALAESRSLLSLMLLFNQARSIQLAHTALSNARHTIEERLARWLVMCHDRTNNDDLPLTHEFMALMLGVRRAGVTTGLHILEGALIIKATRGLIHVRDRDKLEAIAGDAYGVPEAEYTRLLGEYTCEST